MRLPVTVRTKPRRCAPREPIFNGLMLELVLLSAVVMGGVAFAFWYWLLSQGWPEETARNALLLMVLFENVQAFNGRSETLSVFGHNPVRNRLLLFGTLAAQAVHIGAIYTPSLRDVLGISPVPSTEWLELLGMALGLLVAMELHKRLWNRRQTDLAH